MEFYFCKEKNIRSVLVFLCSILHCVYLQVTGWDTMYQENTMEYIGKYSNYAWPNRDLAAVVPGQIVLGALHMIHERSEDKICGKIMPQGGIQSLETMLYTLDYINNQTTFLPGVKIGVLAKDDCDRDVYGLEQTVDFIRGSITNIGGSSYKCKDGSSPENEVTIISGVLGAPSSVTSIQVANLLKLFAIPQISFFSTSPELSNTQRFPYFLRTIPSDVNQAQAMVELVKMFKWTYVSVVYEESSYGMQGFSEVDKLLKEAGVCLATAEKLMKDSGVAVNEEYDKVVFRLLQKRTAKGVIVFGSDQEVGEFMKAVKRMDASGAFTWIGSDGWGARGLAYKGKESEVEGAITVQPLAAEVPGFKNYFMNLRPDTNKRNPWFIEYWEHHFKCKYPGSLWTPLNEEYNATCTGKERVDESNGFELEAQLQFVSDGVLAFAYAARNMHRDLCGGRFGLCPAMDPIDGNTFRRYLLDVSFKSMNGQDFQFLPNGDGPSRYRILNFRQTTPGEYEWATIGFFRDGNLTISSPPIFRIDQPLHPRSVCSRPCSNIQAIIGHDPCCWTCKDCSTFEYLPTRNACIACPMGTIAALDKSFCVLIPQKYLRYNDGISVSAMGLSSLGIIITVWVAIVFYRHRETPVVKASGRELSFVLLGGIFMCYSMTFVLVSKPMTLTCGAQKIGIGLCFSVCYAAILTKTNRISRIFQAGRRTTKRPKFISPESQLVICGALVACQTVISLIWILISPPEAVPYYSNRADHQLVCSSAIGSTYMIGFSYPICLVVICTIYAVLTRKIPEAFNESKYIGFTMYTTCVIWLAFVAIYFSTAHNIEIRIATMCFSISLSATVTLACMFTPKVHIIIFHPERNIRQSMMVPRPAFGKQNSSCVRVDSGTQSDDYELTHRLNSCGSFCSAYSHNSSATQTFTYSNGNSISTQTLDSMDREFDLDDVEL